MGWCIDHYLMNLCIGQTKKMPEGIFTMVGWLFSNSRR